MLEKIFQFLQDVIASKLSFLKILVRSDLRLAIKNFKSVRREDDMVILGNGPSLSGFLENGRKFLTGKMCLGVNYFARTNEYESLKPGYYVIVSTKYWESTDKQSWGAERQKVFDAIADKTDWKLKLFVPAQAKKFTSWRKGIDANPLVEIHYFNLTPVEGLTWWNDLFYRLNLGMPRPHNVLVGSLFLAINMGFKRVYITGADHGWLKDIYVADDNRVYMDYQHFYDSQVSADNDYARAGKKQVFQSNSSGFRKLHELVTKFMVTFKSYWELKRYADKRGVEVVNITPNSYIDAFPRLEVNHGS